MFRIDLRWTKFLFGAMFIVAMFGATRPTFAQDKQSDDLASRMLKSLGSKKGLFGKKAKKLRLNKLSELIHSSDKFTGDNALKECSVEVHFHDIVDTGSGDEDYEVVPGSQMVVTRKCRKVMKLNNKTHEEEEADESW